MLDQEVTNHHLIDINGTVMNIPLNKALMLCMLFLSVIALVYVSIDGTSIRSIITNVVAGVSIISAIYVVAQMIYSNDHLLAMAAFNWTFKSTKNYELNLSTLDELDRKNN